MGSPAWSSPVAGSPPIPPRDGKLVAAGVLSIISGVVVAVGGALFLLFAAVMVEGGDEDDVFSNGLGALFVAVAVVVMAIAALYLVAGIGCVRGRSWGRILSIVIEGLGVTFMLVGLMTIDDASGRIVPLAWCGTILALSVFGKSWS